MPPPPPPAAIVRPYEPPAERFGAGHRGIDLAATPDSPVRSLTPGVVRFAGRVAGIPVVTVGLPDGRRVTYQPVVATVAAGDPVATGDLLGAVPATASSGGHCASAACLHVGLRRYEAYLDPTVLLDAPRPAVLKPS